jgi:hypothetical protein
MWDEDLLLIQEVLTLVINEDRKQDLYSSLSTGNLGI